MEIKFVVDSIPANCKEMTESKPLCDGLYPYEVLAIDYSVYCNNKDNNFVTYWKYSYRINNKKLREMLNSLLQRGYIKLGSLYDAVNLCTISVLKEELKKRGLAVSGKKEVLIDRLIGNVSEEELTAVFDKIPYRQTDLGKQIIEKYEWVLFIHKNLREVIDMLEFAELMQENPIVDYRNNIWVYLERRCERLLKNNDLGFYRNTVLTMSNLAYTEGDVQKAFDLLCVVTAYDLTCSRNGGQDWFLICLQYDLYYSCAPNSLCRVSSYYVSKYKNYQIELDLTDDKLKERIVKNIRNVDLPVRLFTPEECGEIIMAELYEDEEKLKKLYSNAKKEFEKNHQDIFDEIKNLNKKDNGFNVNVSINEE